MNQLVNQSIHRSIHQQSKNNSDVVVIITIQYVLDQKVLRLQQFVVCTEELLHIPRDNHLAVGLWTVDGDKAVIDGIVDEALPTF
jgi:hypothetical protein